MIGPFSPGGGGEDSVRSYELMYVIKPDLDEEKLNAVLEKYSNIIINDGGEIESTDKWGKRRLAYEIDDYREGIYVLVYFKSEPSAAQEIDRVMKISDEILRFMILSREEK